MLDTYRIARELYSHPVVRGNHNLHEPLKNLLHRVALAMSDESLTRQVPRLLELPLANTEGTPVSLDEWCEPSDFVERARLVSAALDADDRERISRRIPFLIHQVGHPSEGKREPRRRALSRLRLLLQTEALAQLQRDELAQAVWRRPAADGNGLPDVCGYYYPSLVLYLPERKPGEATTALRDWLLGTDIAEEGGMFSPEGQKKLPPSFLRRVKLPVETWNFATFPKWRECDKPDTDRRIEWRAEEAEPVMRSAFTLWTNQREELQHWERNPPWLGFAIGGLRKFFLALSTLMTKTLIPYIDAAHPELRKGIHESISQMLEDKVPVQRNLHMLLWLDPGKIGFVLEHVTAGRSSDDEFLAGNTFWGVYDWGLMAKRLDTDEVRVPDALRRAMVNTTMTRNTPAIRTLCEVESAIVRDLPDFYSDDQKDLLCEALEALLHEYPALTASRTCQGSPEDSNDPDLPLSAIQLAGALFSDYERRGPAIPAVLGKWHEIAHAVPLPEFRRGWEEASTL